jgi:hypothetical protein
MAEVCPVCSSDEVREVFRVIGQRQPLKLIRRCALCRHEWEATFAGNTEWLFMPTGPDRPKHRGRLRKLR